MARALSNMLQLGTPAPDFSLLDAVSGKTFTLEDFDGAPALLVMFICNHCPFVIHIREQLGIITRHYQKKGVAIVAINSNSLETHPQDGPEHMKRIAKEKKWSFPFLFDATQEVAKAYQAACTPDFYLFDQERRLVYRGQLDDSRPSNNIPVTGHDLRVAMEAVLHGKPVPEDQKPSVGCNIKWKPGNEPPYFG